jgi:hypothetical protein
MDKGKQLTEVAIRAAIRGAVERGRPRWMHEARGRSRGALSLRIGASGSAVWFFRYWHDGQHRYDRLAPYGAAADELGLAAARDECDAAAAKRATVPDGDLIAQRREDRRKAKADRAAREAARIDREAHTLRKLLDAYVAHLRAAGKTLTAEDARRLLTLHVYEPFAAVADAPAVEFTPEQAADVLRRLVNAQPKPKRRTAAKVRSFVGAAFGLAMKASTDADAPAALKGFRIVANPMRATATVKGATGTKDRALRDAEVRALVRRLAKLDTPAADALRLSLLLGGQRMRQLLRAEVADFDADARTLRLWDAKGRRSEPREHVLPLTDDALAIVERRAAVARRLGVASLFATGAKTVLHHDTAALLARTTAEAMVEAKEAETLFGAGDFRRTVESRLAEMGISPEVRNRIQSHGLGGIVNRHYNRSEWLGPMRTALDAWGAWLAAEPASNVRPLRAARA